MRFVTISESSATWNLESLYELGKGQAIVVRPYDFVGDPVFRQRFRTRVEEALRTEEREALKNPRKKRALAETRESERVLMASLQNDPDTLYDPAQIRYRQQKRAEYSGGEDLPTAHQNLIAAFDGASAPWAVDLHGDQILVLFELVEAWLIEGKDEDKPPKAEGLPQMPGDYDDALPDVAAAFLADLRRLLGNLRTAAQQVREQRLLKLRTRTRAKGLVR